MQTQAPEGDWATCKSHQGIAAHAPLQFAAPFDSSEPASSVLWWIRVFPKQSAPQTRNRPGAQTQISHSVFVHIMFINWLYVGAFALLSVLLGFPWNNICIFQIYTKFKCVKWKEWCSEKQAQAKTTLRPSSLILAPQAPSSWHLRNGTGRPNNKCVPKFYTELPHGAP